MNSERINQIRAALVAWDKSKLAFDESLGATYEDEYLLEVSHGDDDMFIRSQAVDWLRYLLDENERLQKLVNPPPTISNDAEEILINIKLAPDLPGTKDTFICADKKSVYVSFHRDLTSFEYQTFEYMGLRAEATPIQHRYYISRIEAKDAQP